MICKVIIVEYTIQAYTHINVYDILPDDGKQLFRWMLT